MKYTLRMTKGEVLKRMVESAEYAKERGLYVHAVSEDTTRSDEKLALRFFATSIEAGAKGIVVCDTLGVSTPSRMRSLAGTVRRFLEADNYSVHCHDDLGLATANTVAAVEAGFEAPQTTVCGIGERAGNAAFEEVCLALETLHKTKTGIRTERIYRLAEMVEKYSGVPLAVHKPVVGTNSFTHEAGVHVAAVLRNPLTYELLRPESVGRKRRFSLGKHSGTALVGGELRNHGIQVTSERVRAIVERLKDLKEGRSKKRLRELVNAKKALDAERGGVSEREFRNLIRSARKMDCRC